MSRHRPCSLLVFLPSEMNVKLLPYIDVAVPSARIYYNRASQNWLVPKFGGRHSTCSRPPALPDSSGEAPPRFSRNSSVVP